MLVDEKIKDVRHVDNRIVKIMGEDEALWEFPQDDKIGAPGNRTLLAGNMDAGWFGEVPSSDFITGSELSNLTGIKGGSLSVNDVVWLKFAYNGNVLLISKKCIRRNVIWADINGWNCVDGSRTLTIKGKRYRIMLMKGCTAEFNNRTYNSFSDLDDRELYINSMWNKLMLPIHENAPDKWYKGDPVNIPTDDWNVNYTNSDLETGSITICQENYYMNGKYQRGIGRGEQRLSSHISTANSEDAQREYRLGWRPCLELIG